MHNRSFTRQSNQSPNTSHEHRRSGIDRSFAKFLGSNAFHQDTIRITDDGEKSGFFSPNKSSSKLEVLKKRVDHVQSRIKRLAMNENNVRNLQNMIHDLETSQYARPTIAVDTEEEQTSRFEILAPPTRKTPKRDEVLVEKLNDEVNEKNMLIMSLHKEKLKIGMEFKNFYWFIEEIKLWFDELITTHEEPSKEYVMERLKTLRKLDDSFRAVISMLEKDWIGERHTVKKPEGSKNSLLYTFNVQDQLRKPGTSERSGGGNSNILDGLEELGREEDFWGQELKYLKIVEHYKEMMSTLERDVTKNKRVTVNAEDSLHQLREELKKKDELAKQLTEDNVKVKRSYQLQEEEIKQLQAMLQDARNDFTALSTQIVKKNNEKDISTRALNTELLDARKQLEGYKKLEQVYKEEIARKNEELHRREQLLQGLRDQLEQMTEDIKREKEELISALTDEQRKNIHLEKDLADVKELLKQKEQAIAQHRNCSALQVEANGKSLATLALIMQQLPSVLSDPQAFESMDIEMMQTMQRYVGENGLQIIRGYHERKEKMNELTEKSRYLNDILSARIQRSLYFLDEFLKCGALIMNTIEILGRSSPQDLPTSVVMLRQELDLKKPQLSSKLVELTNEINDLKYELQNMNNAEGGKESIRSASQKKRIGGPGGGLSNYSKPLQRRDASTEDLLPNDLEHQFFLLKTKNNFNSAFKGESPEKKSNEYAPDDFLMIMMTQAQLLEDILNS